MSANEHRAFFKKYEKYLKSAESRVHCFIQKDAFNLKSHIFEFIFEITKKNRKMSENRSKQHKFAGKKDVTRDNRRNVAVQVCKEIFERFFF